MARVIRGLLACALICAAGALLPASPPAGAAASRPSVTISPAVPMIGETVRLRTRLPTRIVRPAWLQRHRDGRWRTVARTRSLPTGVVTFDRRATRAGQRLRVRAPAHRSAGRRHAPVRSQVRSLAGSPQTVGFTARRGAGGQVDVRVDVSHARRGRVATLEARTLEGTWATLARGPLGGSRTSTLLDMTTLAQATGRRLRVRLAAHEGAPSVVSAVQDPPRVRVAATVGDDGVDAVATVEGAVERVAFFADGVLLTEDTSAPWSAAWSPRVGAHDVVARAFGPLDSALSPAVVVHVPPAPIGVDSGVAEGFAIETVQTGLVLPTSAATLPSGAVLVTEKSGRVKIVEPADETGFALPREVLDLRAEVHDGGDAGLIGIAADPGFAENGFVYLSYVRDDGPGELRSQQVVRFTWDDGALAPGSRTVVLGSVTGDACAGEGNLRTPDCLPLLGESHTIGDLGFDPEGRLLVGVGDGALYVTDNGLAGRLETLRAQDPDMLAGKILRIDPATGRGVPDNPLYSGDGSDNASRVIALGLRNPFRFTVHEGRLVLGDVGEGTAEEINVQLLDQPEEPVANYGWPCLEGADPTALGEVEDPTSPWHPCAAVRAPDGSRPPAHTYPHSGGAGGSVSGGVVLESAAYPAAWRGRYVFGDYAQNRIWTAEMTADGEMSGVTTLVDPSAAQGPVKFFTGPDGLTWTVAIASGSLRRIRHTGAPSADRCAVGTFQRSFHDLDGPDSVFDREFAEDEWRWLFPYAAAQLPPETLAEATCETEIRLASTSGSPWTTPESPDERDHPGDRFGTLWRGRVDLEPGTYRFVVQGSEWVRLWVDGHVLHDFYANDFWSAETRTHEVVLEAGQHHVRAELVHGDADVAAATVTWTRIGSPPSIALTAPANGVVAATGAVPWSVAVSDPDGDDPDALGQRVELAVDFLHYTGSAHHVHPTTRISGQTSGTLAVDDVHAPGTGVVRLTAAVTDASGARSTSAPVYICFPGGAVGPCDGAG